MNHTHMLTSRFFSHDFRRQVSLKQTANIRHNTKKCGASYKLYETHFRQTTIHSFFSFCYCFDFSVAIVLHSTYCVTIITFYVFFNGACRAGSEQYYKLTFYERMNCICSWKSHVFIPSLDLSLDLVKWINRLVHKANVTVHSFIRNTISSICLLVHTANFFEWTNKRSQLLCSYPSSGRSTITWYFY